MSCNQLGYNGAVSLRAISQSNSFAWISAVDCYGDEGRLVECDYWGGAYLVMPWLRWSALVGRVYLVNLHCNY